MMTYMVFIFIVAWLFGATSHSTPAMPRDESLVMLFMVASPLRATSHSTSAMSGDESLVTLFIFPVFDIIVASL